MRPLKHLLALPMATVILIACPTIPSTLAQESNAESSEGLDPKAPTLKEQIDALLKDGNPEAARNALQEALNAKSIAIKTESDMIRLHNLHHAIAFGFYHKQEYAKAVDELVMSFDGILGSPDTLRKAYSLVNIVETMEVLGSRSGKDDPIATKIDQAIEYCRKIEAENVVEVQFALSRLVLMRAKTLLQKDKSLATDMLIKQIATLKTINASDNSTEQTIAAQFRLLVEAGSLLNDFDDRAEMERLLASAIRAFPESARVLEEFASAQYEAVRNLARHNPSKAALRLESTIERLTPLAGDNNNLREMIDRIKELDKQIGATAKQQDMIGKPAPNLKFDAWTNVDELNIDDLKGKVVLLDFWAAWCGPCIDTFPHLRRWRKDYGEKGFEIVGITRYYNYEWNEDVGRASRSEEEVDPEVERSAIAKFLQSKEMQHPTVFMPKDSSSWQEYGVAGIPHAVLIDRNGIVQLVRVGSGQENVDALHKKIRELIDQ
jgi:thiol-disulfide isomerase/thioredoxin